MTQTKLKEKQLQEIIQVIEKIAQGDFTARILLQEKNEDIDALAVGINMLAEELETKTHEQLDKDEAILFMLEDLEEQKNKLTEAYEMVKQSEIQLKIAQDDLKKLNEHLEEKVQERTKEVQHLLNQKDEFINQIGHDLKTPLGPLINLIPMLAKTETDPKRIEMFDIIERNAHYLKESILKTIKLAQLNSTNMQMIFDTINLSQEFIKIITQNQPMLTQKNITLDYQIPENIMINIDKTYFHDLISNILGNAISYSDENTSIRIYAQDNPDSITFSVKDTGIGMNKDQLNKVFDEFYKADWSRHDFNHSGLGLSICKRIVELHGGSITIDSKGIGQGTTVHFTLPKHHTE